MLPCQADLGHFTPELFTAATPLLASLTSTFPLELCHTTQAVPSTTQCHGSLQTLRRCLKFSPTALSRPNGYMARLGSAMLHLRALIKCGTEVIS